MDFFEMIEGRRSVRRFKQEPVSKEDIARMLKTALEAPSSKNSRSSSFLVVDEPQTIARIAGMRDFGSAFVQGAPLVILVMGDESKSDLWKVNASISATYLQLAVEALGLGSCWVHVEGRPHKKEDTDGLSAEDYLRAFLPVPMDRRILCAIAVGRPAENAGRQHRDMSDAKEKVITL